MQRRCWNLLLANAYDDLPKKETFCIGVDELARALHFESKNLDYLKNSLEALVRSIVKWNILKKDKEEWGIAALLSEVKITGDQVFYSYSPTIRKKLYNPSMYAKISLVMQNKFSSKYTLALYELFIDYFMNDVKRGETPFIKVDDLRLLLGVEGSSYLDNFYRFNNKILQKALKEINEKSDLDVKVEYKKNKRKTVALKFIVKLKDNSSNLSILKKCKDSKYLEYFSILQKKFLLTSTQAEKVLDRYSDFKLLDSLLKEIEQKYKKKEIKNLGAYAYRFLIEHP